MSTKISPTIQGDTIVLNEIDLRYDRRAADGWRKVDKGAYALTARVTVADGNVGLFQTNIHWPEGTVPDGLHEAVLALHEAVEAEAGQRFVSDTKRAEALEEEEP